jgi:DNA-binding CsgD family transcriptional regulator
LAIEPAAPRKDQTTPATWEISPYIVFGLLGFTLYLTWMLMFYASPAIDPEQLYMTTTGRISPFAPFFRFAQLAALCLTLLIAWQASDSFSSKRGVLLQIIFSILLNGVAFCLVALVKTPDTLMFVAWVALGIAQGMMIILWSSFLATIGKTRIVLFAAICIGCAGLIYLLMGLLRPEAVFWITCTLSVFTVLLFVLVHYRYDYAAAAMLIKAKVSDSRQAIQAKSAISVFIYSTGVGFAVCLLISQNPNIIGSAFVGGAIVIAGILTIIDTLYFHKLSENLLVRMHLPALIIGIGPLFFDNLAGRTFSSGLFLIFLAIIYILNLTALSEHTRIFQLSPVRVFGFGRLGNAAGFLLGAVAYYLAFEVIWPVGMQSDLVLRIVLVGIIALFIVGQSFIFEDHYPVPEDPYMRSRAHANTEHPLPTGDLKTLSSFNAEADATLGAKAGAWRRRCTKLAKIYELSPKETEVLLLLAKGRNAEFIQNELVVSRHTAKAHIYHIYQKTNVHSRQELIDLLESIDLSDE